MEADGIKLDLSILDQLTIPDYKPKSADGKVEKTPIIEEKRERQDMIQDFESDDVEEDFDPFITPTDGIEEEEEVEEVESDSPIKVWAEFASQRGLIDIEEGEQVGDSEEYLITKFNDKISKLVDSYKESLPDQIKDLLHAYEQGVPINELLESEARIAEFSQIDKNKLKEDVSLQKQLVKSYLMSQEYDADEIESKLEKYEDNLLLEDEANSALKKLIKLEQKEKEYMIEQSKRAQEAQMRDYQHRVETFKKSVMDKEEIIAGIPITKEQKEKIIKMTTQPVSMLKDGTPVTALKKMELEDPDFLTKLAYVAGVLNWDLSTVEKTANTKAARSVKAKVNTYKDSPLSKLDINAIRKAVNISKKQLFK